MKNIATGFRTHMFSMGETHLKMHKNNTSCVIFSRDLPLNVSNDESEVEAHIVSIRPNVLHRASIGSEGADVLYFDGIQYEDRKPDFERLDKEWALIPNAMRRQDYRTVEAFREFLGYDNYSGSIQMVNVIDELYSDPFIRMSQDDLAERLGLERTQALRFFKTVTGQSFRKFKKWAGLIAASHMANRGDSIGLAAIDAGFSDAAHISRTAKEVFGLTPTIALSTLTSLITLENKQI